MLDIADGVFQIPVAVNTGGVIARRDIRAGGGGNLVHEQLPVGTFRRIAPVQQNVAVGG